MLQESDLPLLQDPVSQQAGDIGVLESLLPKLPRPLLGSSAPFCGCVLTDPSFWGLGGSGCPEEWVHLPQTGEQRNGYQPLAENRCGLSPSGCS